MSDVYTRVMTGSAVAGGITASCYIIASTMAFTDGVDTGVEVPRPVNTWCIMLIVCCAVIAGCAWTVRRGLTDAAEHDIRPIIREELDRAITEQMPLLVATVVESLDRRIVPQMHDVAVAAGKQTVVRIRDVITADLTEIVGDLHRRAMITGALADRAATGRPGLRPVPHRYVSTPEGD